MRQLIAGYDFIYLFIYYDYILNSVGERGQPCRTPLLISASFEDLELNTEDKLQKAGNKLNQIITECGLTISAEQKSMKFKGQEPFKSKIVIANKIIEELNSSKYLGNLISYEKEGDIDNKLSNCLKITGVINNVFRPQKTLKRTNINLNNTLTLAALLYGSETWTIKARDARRITAAGIKYMRITAGDTWTDHKANAELAKELNITPVLNKIEEYKRNIEYTT
jgi:hypothetical protein